MDLFQNRIMISAGHMHVYLHVFNFVSDDLTFHRNRKHLLQYIDIACAALQMMMNTLILTPAASMWSF